MFTRAQGFFDDYERKGYPSLEYYVEQNSISMRQVNEYDSLIKQKVKETELDNYIRNNKEIMVNALDFVSTGHQGAWVIPQQQIKIATGCDDKGLIPDYLVAGKSSDGFAWWVIEFKGANENLFTTYSNGEVALSGVANKGCMQLLEYIDFCNEHQATLRDQLGLTDFREPKGMLIIGTENEVEDNPRLKKLKAAWNRTVCGTLDIRTHHSLIRSAGVKAKFHDNYS